MKIIFLLAILITFSCAENQKKEESHTSEKQLSKPQKTIIQNKKIDFDITSFTNIPEEIDGCGCYFYLSQQDEKNEQYIYVNDFANLAFISINNELTEFNLISKQDSFYLYSNKFYELKVEIKEKNDTGDESTEMKGKLILSKEGVIVEKDFIGSCGC